MMDIRNLMGLALKYEKSWGDENRHDKCMNITNKNVFIFYCMQSKNYESDYRSARLQVCNRF